jgi:type VI secretion system lysozyme-like protein
VSQPKFVVGASAPLFEKLTDLSPTTGVDDPDLKFQTRESLAASIRREVARIFDTRLPWEPDEEDEAARRLPDAAAASVIRYGVADFTHLSVFNLQDRRLMEGALTEAIRRFEPRLQEPKVVLVPGNRPGWVHLEISGRMACQRTLEPVSFQLETAWRGAGADRT